MNRKIMNANALNYDKASCFLEGFRVQIIGFQGPNTILLMVFGP